MYSNNHGLYIAAIFKDSNELMYLTEKGQFSKHSWRGHRFSPDFDFEYAINLLEKKYKTAVFMRAF